MKFLAILFILISTGVGAQTLYFPPTTGTTWDTIQPSRLGWCPERIDSLYSYLSTRNTDAFIVLKDGKIVLEKYFGTFTADSIHYWASAGKSLTALLTGMAQERGLFNINDSVANSIHIGWTSAPAVKEGRITLKHLLTMTSGLNDTVGLPCDNEDTIAYCLRYLADAGTRWAYHTGAYKKLQTAISMSAGINYNVLTANYLGSHIGMTGFWYNGMYYSNARGMARFGLLALNKAIWNTDTLLHDTTYFHNMVNTSQAFNQSYGYLWWLNGKSSYMAPGLQYVFSGSLIPNAPADMICALGKNDQKIYIVPSQKLVVIRTGESAYGVAMAFSPFDNELWGKIDSLGQGCTTGLKSTSYTQVPTMYPNPANDFSHLDLADSKHEVVIYDWTGKKMYTENKEGKVNIDLSSWPAGLYLVKIMDTYGNVSVEKLIKTK